MFEYTFCRIRIQIKYVVYENSKESKFYKNK